jgi:hypothetical protein
MVPGCNKRYAVEYTEVRDLHCPQYVTALR